jgi:hypothetical protein
LAVRAYPRDFGDIIFIKNKGLQTLELIKNDGFKRCALPITNNLESNVII